jgi:DNA-binding MarR family transcriptional regulator
MRDYSRIWFTVAMPDMDPLTACLHLVRLEAHLRTALERGLADTHGLGVNDLQILLHLDAAPNRRLRRADLAERLGVTTSGVTRMIVPLERRGLVLRVNSDRDARVWLTTLTDRGHDVLATALPTARRAADELLRGRLSARQLDTIIGLTSRLYAPPGLAMAGTDEGDEP